MKKMKRLFCFLLAFTLTFGCMSEGVFAETGTRPADGVTEGQPFASGTGGSANFRIPCLVTLDNGTLVAACDARWNHSSDACGLDTIVSRSKDNGATWRYTFANYLGDNGNAFNYNSTAFIDPAIATDGETVYMIADLYPAGIAINTTPNTHRPLVGSTGFDENDNLILAAATDEINGLSPSADRISQSFDYHLEKNPDEYGESYYLLKDAQGNTVEEYVIDAFFNIRGEGVDTNIFCGDSPYYPWPADYLYMTKSTNGGRSWSEPKLLNLKKAEEQTLLVGPGRGIYTSSGRILFTCYEFTNTDKNSACIYSDDGGETWQRGESVSGWSSEAVVTEADGKIYMFTRHGNCYYVSQDNGTTWSSPVSVPKAYNSNCQLTAITYSEKIDGKTAILLAAPSSTSGRQNGKIFVGLVQEDGTISWDYEYEINKGGAAYAYSCLTELTNGELGLLYESAGSAITYKTIAIEDVAKGATIGNLWLEKDETPVSQCNLTPDGSEELTLMGIEEGVEVQAESSNPDAVTVSVSGNTVTITGRTVTGLAEADITITAGGKTTSLKVYVTASPQYEIVDLHMGETKTYRDKTGDYSSADLSGVDTDVARVTVTGDSVARQQAQLATADATFDGDTIEVDSCLYTFEEINADEHTYKISGKAGETTVYVNLSGGKKPNSTTEKTVKILAGATAGTFKLQDLTGGSNDGAAHLHFYSDNLSRLYYDRCGTSCGVKDEFEFYTPSDNAPADSPVQGYAKVSSLSDITNGGKYLIVRKADDNNYYIMHPANNANTYDYVAKLGEIPEAPAVDAKAQLATANAVFDGDEIDVGSCQYTFEAVNADEHTYKISGKAGDTTVYLNTSTKPNSTTEKTVKILAGATTGTFKLQDLTGGSNDGVAHLHFYSDNLSKLHYDRCGNSCGVKDEFELYTRSDNAPADSPVQGYAKVSSLSDITNGGKYLIVRKANDNNYYIMHPANNAEVYNYVAKIVESSQGTGTETGNGSTEITIEAVGEGNTSATIGNVTYYIRVANVVKNIQLELEETYSVPGTIQKSGDSNIVTSEEVVEMPPYTATEEITAGKYLIGRGAYIVTDSENTSSTPQGLVLKLADYEAGSHADSLWTVAQAEGGYTLQGAQGKYMTFSGQNILMSDTPQTLTFANCAGEAGKTITGNGTNWLNQWGGDSSTLAAGWTQANNGWVFYAPAAGIKLTGTTVGTTTMTIGNVNYNITVVEKTTPADYTKVNEAIAEAEALNRGNYVSFDAVDDAIEAVVTGLRNTEQDRVDAMAKAITDAIGALELKSANYRAVDAAIMAAEALDRDAYKDLSAVDAAVEAVVRGKDITEQSAVDAMAQAITDAIAALEPWSGANYAGVEAAIARANGLNPDNYVSFDAVTDAINEAEKEENQNLLENEQERVDAMADAINAAIDALVLKDADYTEVNEAIEKANGLDEELYKDFSAVEEAIAKVVEGKNITEQSEVDAMAQAIKNAIAALEYKDADYSKVDAVIEKSRNLNVNLYKDFSGVEAAIAAVSKDKNITEQSEVDAMAKAIEDAITALEYKDADYSRVDAAIETANKLIKANYKDFSKVEAAIAAVVRGKDITEQSGVDAMAKAITDAIAALEPKESETPGSSGGTSSGSQSGTSSGSQSSTGTSDKPTEVIPATGSQSSQTASQTNSQNTASNAGTAQTGDNAQTGLYVALLLIAAAAVGGVIFYKKKDKKDNK